MKKTISGLGTPRARPKRLNVSEAKAKLSQALRELEDGPTIIHNRGRDLAVLISTDAYQRLLDAEGTSPRHMSAFLDVVAKLKRDFGGGFALNPARAELVAQDPFKERE